MTNRKKLNEIYPDWIDGTGFFSTLYTVINSQVETMPEWLPDSNFAEKLNLEYHGNNSGDKPVSNLVQKFYDANPPRENYMEKVAGMFYALHANSIERMWAVYVSEYNPIENYSMTESGTDTKTGTDTLTYKGTTQNAQTGTQRLQGETHTTGNIYGFNSANPTPADKADGSSDTTRTDNLTNTQSFTNRNDETEYNTELSHEMTRSGNIGVTTSQQMLQSELELWKWNFYKTYLFPLVDTILTLPIYCY